MNHATVSIWWHIHCPGVPELNGQKRRNSRYLRGSNGYLAGSRSRSHIFQSMSSSLSEAMSASGRRQRLGWFTFQRRST